MFIRGKIDTASSPRSNWFSVSVLVIISFAMRWPEWEEMKWPNVLARIQRITTGWRLLRTSLIQQINSSASAAHPVGSYMYEYMSLMSQMSEMTNEVLYEAPLQRRHLPAHLRPAAASGAMDQMRNCSLGRGKRDHIKCKYTIRGTRI